MRPPSNPDFSAVKLNEIMAEELINGRTLARRVGCTDSTVSQWRHGKSTPTDEMLLKLCTALGVKATELVTGDGVDYYPAAKPAKPFAYDPTKDLCRCDHPKVQHSTRIPTSCQDASCSCRGFISRLVLNRGRREEKFWDSIGRE